MAWSSLHLSCSDNLRDEAFPGVTAATLRHVSHQFLNSALNGYRDSLQVLHTLLPGSQMHSELFEAVYLASSMISLCTLCQLGGNHFDAALEGTEDEILWVKLVMGTRQIVGQWKNVHGRDSWLESKVFTSKPNLSTENMAELFSPENRVLLNPILDWASQYIVLDSEEQQAYEYTLSYIGLVYYKILDGSESPQAACVRLQALPARVPRRFGLAVVDQRPLALTILAYAFALMKLLEDVIPWFSGIAEKQIPLIQQKIPPGWWPVIQWPLRIASGEIGKETALTVLMTSDTTLY